MEVRVGTVTRTNIEIDQELMKEAMAATGQTTQRATVEAALRTSVRLARQKTAGEAMAGIGWDGDLAEMRAAREARNDKPA